MGTTTLRLPDEKLRLIRAISGYENLPLSKIYEGLTDEYVRRYRETRELTSKEGFLEICSEGLKEIKTTGGVSIRELDETRIKFSTQAGQDFLRFNNLSRNKIIAALSDLVEDENFKENYLVWPLTGDLRGFYRIRTGNFRVIFSTLEDKTLAIVSVLQTSSGENP